MNRDRYSPISAATVSNFDLVLLTNTTFLPSFARCLAYDFPMPSVAPVITEENANEIITLA